jgi:hypothetical protein
MPSSMRNFIPAVKFGKGSFHRIERKCKRFLGRKLQLHIQPKDEISGASGAIPVKKWLEPLKGPQILRSCGPTAPLGARIDSLIVRPARWSMRGVVAAEPKRGDVPPIALLDGCERMVLRLQPCEQALHLCGMPTSTIPWRRHPALVERVSAMPFRLVIPAARTPCARRRETRLMRPQSLPRHYRLLTTGGRRSLDHVRPYAPVVVTSAAGVEQKPASFVGPR